MAGMGGAGMKPRGPGKQGNLILLPGGQKKPPCLEPGTNEQDLLELRILDAELCRTFSAYNRKVKELLQLRTVNLRPKPRVQ
jgi:hypothetical protein